MIDKTLKFSLDTLRVDAHTRAEVAAILTTMQNELIARLAAGGVTAWSKARIDGQIADANVIINDYYKRVEDTVTATTTGVYRVAAGHTADTVLAITTSAGASASAIPASSAMQALVSNVLVQGAVQADWWAKQAADTRFRFATAVRQGLAAAETNQQIIKRITSELAVAQNNAATLVQTSVQTVANEARLETFKANADVILGVQWLATLDSHTCVACGVRDLATWAIDGSVISATAPFVNPPLHFNCRCVLLPLTEFSSKGNPQRASANGPVSAKVTFTDFLNRQSTAFQDETLGPGRAQMYRDGKITLQDLINGNGRPLTLAQLQEKYKN